MTTTTTEPRGHLLHVGVAEHGKVLALEGEHREAMRHYREANRMAIQAGAPEVFFRHYTQCALESLEALGSHTEVIEFCERAEAHYAEHPPPNELAELDLASIRERKAVNLLGKGELTAAREALEQAVAKLEAGRLPLAESLLGWLRRGLHVESRRLEQELARHNYYVVRADQVDASRAIPLPEVLGPRFS